MNVQLLLLLALVGPFCAFTHASPTEIPSELQSVPALDEGTEAPAVAHVTTDATVIPKEELTVITGPPPTEPAALPEVVATTATIQEAASPSVALSTEEPAVQTEPAAVATAAPEPVVTEAPAVETAAPAQPTEAPQAEAEADAGTEAKEDEDVVIEDSLSTGQVVGIVIGALLAVVIVIAVVIAVVRRMGKYSSAKNKKPAKKDSAVVSPLRKKPAKQQERPKFWKF